MQLRSQPQAKYKQNRGSEIMSNNLVDYLKNLNSANSNWYLWVNPDNVDEFEVNQQCPRKGWFNAGSLNNISYGMQSMEEAVRNYLSQCDGVITGFSKKIRFNLEGMMEAYKEDRLSEELRRYLEVQGTEIMMIWSEQEAEIFVDETLRKNIWEWQQEMKE
jgi:hypothetical protein